MKRLLTIIRFCGTVPFAIILIASTVLFVIAGTLIESKTESHRYAALMTYQHPLFILLLWGFFFNILISALRRWPFRLQHIPFLITHFGLLMILLGTLIKTSYGLQGNMNIWEGSGSQSVFIPDSFAIHLEKRTPLNLTQTVSKSYPLSSHWAKGFHSKVSTDDSFKELEIQLIGYAPHSREILQAWIYGDHGCIQGIDPFPVFDCNQLDNPLPLSGRLRFHGPFSQPWDLIALRTPAIDKWVQKAYLQGMEVCITNRTSGECIFSGNLEQALESPHLPEEVHLELQLNFTTEKGFEQPSLIAHVPNGKIAIPLQGGNSLINTNLTPPYAGKHYLAIDLKRIPTLILMESHDHDVWLLAFDAHGQVHAEVFHPDKLHSIFVYDQGYGGYGMQAIMPFASQQNGRKERELANRLFFQEQLEQGLAKTSHLSPPLEWLQKACEGTTHTLTTSCLEFLTAWDAHQGWLYSVEAQIPDSLLPVIMRLDWNQLSDNERKACMWCHVLFNDLEPQLRLGDDLLQVLANKGWPFTKPLQELEGENPDQYISRLTALTQQIFVTANYLPEPPQPNILSPILRARMLSAFFRAYHIHLETLMPQISESDMRERLQHYLGIDDSPIILESPITARRRPEIDTMKLEDQTPIATFLIKHGNQSEQITLTYDRLGHGWKWPLFNGEYLISFQPHIVNLPYRIRLKQARQITYAQSSQPFSYESDLLITNTHSQDTLEKTISMNHVHETWEGYRFYLSNMTPANEGSVKRIQLVVNYDPAKYILTYPGAIVLSLGIFLLFWKKKRGD